MVCPTDSMAADRTSSLKWRPFILHRWTITGLSFCLVAILAVIAVLYAFSLHSGLYEKAFTYETQVVISDTHLSTVAPYSIIPTAFAVGIGLWWGSMETEFRLLQPFLAMARRPVTFSHGVNLSYQSSYLLWAAVKAALHNH